jgi:iron complex transport system substrate-binding protein
MKTKYIGTLVGLLLVLLVLGACGKDSNSTQTKETKKDVTITDAMGNVTIPANVKHILAPYMEDSLVALGVKPAAQWSIGTTVLDYLQPELKDVPKIGWDMPLEQTIKANPDLIVFSSKSAIQNGQYEEYKKVAPTYVFKEEEGADWRKQLLAMGNLLGREKTAKEKLADYDKKAEIASKEIKAAIGNESAAIIWVSGEQYYLFENARFAANVLYKDLGVSEPKMIQGLPKVDANWKPISLESLSNLDADHLFIVSKPQEPGLDKLKKSSIYKGLTAIQKGNVYEINDPSNWTINGLVANELTIDEIVKSLKM